LLDVIEAAEFPLERVIEPVRTAARQGRIFDELD